MPLGIIQGAAILVTVYYDFDLYTDLTFVNGYANHTFYAIPSPRIGQKVDPVGQEQSLLAKGAVLALCALLNVFSFICMRARREGAHETKRFYPGWRVSDWQTSCCLSPV